MQSRQQCLQAQPQRAQAQPAAIHLEAQRAVRRTSNYQHRGNYQHSTLVNSTYSHQELALVRTMCSSEMTAFGYSTHDMLPVDVNLNNQQEFE